MRPQSTPWLIHELLPGTFASIVGEPGAGKTAVAADLAVHLLAGTPWRGRKAKRCAIACVSSFDASALINRIELAGQRRGITPGTLLAAPFTLATTENEDTRQLSNSIADWHRDAANDQRLVFLVDSVDPLIERFSREKRAATFLVLHRLNKLALELGASLIIVGTDRADGPLARNTSSDTTLLVANAGEVGHLQVLRSREGPDDIAVSFTFTKDRALCTLGWAEAPVVASWGDPLPVFSRIHRPLAAHVGKCADRISDPAIREQFLRDLMRAQSLHNGATVLRQRAWATYRQAVAVQSESDLA